MSSGQMSVSQMSVGHFFGQLFFDQMPVGQKAESLAFDFIVHSDLATYVEYHDTSIEYSVCVFVCVCVHVWLVSKFERETERGYELANLKETQRKVTKRLSLRERE